MAKRKIPRMPGLEITKTLAPFRETWRGKYKIVSGYHGDFDIVDLATGLSLGKSFPSVLVADRYLADEIISKELEKYLV